jgi:RNA polymerase sigma factor (sigma-70 family)
MQAISATDVQFRWFDELVEETRADLTFHTRRFISCPDDAQEIVQEAYLRVFCMLRDADLCDHQPRALLYKTTRNIAISRSRHLKVVRDNASYVSIAEDLRCVIADTEREATTTQQLDRLRQALALLPPRCRQVVLLRLEGGLSQRDIAQRIGIAESTVEKHLAKGLKSCTTHVRQLENCAVQ